MVCRHHYTVPHYLYDTVILVGVSLTRYYFVIVTSRYCSVACYSDICTGIISCSFTLWYNPSLLLVCLILKHCLRYVWHVLNMHGRWYVTCIFTSAKEDM